MALKVKVRSTKTSTKKKDDDYDDYDDQEDEDFEDDEPRRQRGKKSSSSSKRRARDDDDEDEDDDDEDDDDYGLKGGWGEYDETKARASDYPNELKLKDDEPSLVRFLDEAPLVTYLQHWIERKGKKSFVCLNKNKADKLCPLCDIGERVQVKIVFNVVGWVNGDPVNLIIIAGKRMTDQIHGALARLQKRNPKAKLTDAYFEITRTGKKGDTNFSVKLVKERDLDEDWSTEPLTDKELKKLRENKWSIKATVRKNTRKELTEIARESVGDYDEDDD